MEKYIILDLEMCKVNQLACLNKYHLRREIIQIGAVLVDENYTIIDSFKQFVKPRYGSVDVEITKLTGICREDVKDAKYYEEVLADFMEWMCKDSVIVSWSESDLYQMMDECDEKGIDTSELDPYFDSWMDCQRMFSDKMNTSKIYKLSEALRISDVHMERSEHDALSDAINTARLFKKINVEDTLILSAYYAI